MDSYAAGAFRCFLHQRRTSTYTTEVQVFGLVRFLVGLNILYFDNYEVEGIGTTVSDSDLQIVYTAKGTYCIAIGAYCYLAGYVELYSIFVGAFRFFHGLSPVNSFTG